MSVLRDYHAALGELVFAYEGTLEHFAGDGLMVFFNDPPPCPDAPERAVRMALEMRDRVDELATRWRRQGHDLGFGVGIAQGYATLGRVGFEGRWDYAAIGTVTNVAARLCAAAASPPDPHQPARARRPRRALRDALARADGAARHLAAPRGPRGHRHRRAGGRPMNATIPSTSPRRRPSPDRGVALDDLDEEARGELFDVLQGQLPEVWRLMRQGDPLESVVVVPSMSVDRLGPSAGAMNQAMEERFLFLLLLLRQPRLRMVYVTSMPIHEHVIEYYLSLLPGVIPSHARARLTLVAVGDSSPTPLTDKLLERPRLLARIASLVPDPARSHLLPYTSTTRERDLSLLLGIPMYAADPRLYPLGTKTGCRRVFAEAGVAHPFGAEDLHSVDDVVDAVLDLHAARPAARWAMVKLNEGVSGSGNALVDLAGLPAGQADPGSGDDDALRALATERVRGMQLEDEQVDIDAYLRRLEERGRDRRGARRRRRGAQSQRAAAGDAARGARDPLDARPDPRRPDGPDLPRGALPGRPGLRDGHHRRGGEGRSGPRRQGGPRALRPRLRRRPARGPTGRRTPSRSTCAGAARRTRS